MYGIEYLSTLDIAFLSLAAGLVCGTIAGMIRRAKKAEKDPAFLVYGYINTDLFEKHGFFIRNEELNEEYLAIVKQADHCDSLARVEIFIDS